MGALTPQAQVGRGSVGLPTTAKPMCYSVPGGVALAAATPQAVTFNTGQLAGGPEDIRAVTLDNTANASSCSCTSNAGDVMWAGPNQCVTRPLFVDRQDLTLNLMSRQGGTVGLVVYNTDMDPATTTAP